MRRKNHRLSTRCVHAGELRTAEGSPHTPIFNSSTFAFKTTADLLDVVEGRKVGNLYTRYGLNPTLRALEEKLASLEGAEAALSFSAGMAAEAALFFAHGQKGIVGIGNAYGGTLELLAEQCPQLGIPTWFLFGDEVDRLEEVLEKKPGLVFFETPSNPTLEVFEIRKISEAAHACGALSAVDNTFATPLNQRPLEQGADLVVHSATKYMGGHSDITAGAVMGSKELLEAIGPWRRNLGQTLSPETANLLARSLRTLVVRVKHQNESAAAVAEAMEAHPNIARVHYPGLASFPFHETAKSQMSDFGGMLAIEIDGSGEETTRVVDSLKIFSIAASLGGAESLVTQPVTTTHHGVGPEERRRRGISDSLIRLSIGLESAEDLIEDLTEALAILET